MPLINLKTNLKSLKFGKDRPGGGSSNQPYIQKDIPEDNNKVNILRTGGPDVLLRGGMIAPIRAATDVSRLTQMFFDLKSPTGLLFVGKQNLLSRASIKTEATKGPAYGGKAINAGIYTPLNTIAQAGVGFTGTHLNLLGLDPSSPISGVVEGKGIFPKLGLNRYEDIVKANNSSEDNFFPLSIETTSKTRNPLYLAPILGGQPPSQEPEFLETTTFTTKGGFKNRLLNIWYNKQLGTDNSPNILEYGGGPGSILGIGKTNIKFADQRTGDRNPLYSSNPGFFFGTSNKNKHFLNPQSKDISLKLGVTKFTDLLSLSENDKNIFKDNPNRILENYFVLDRKNSENGFFKYDRDRFDFDRIAKLSREKLNLLNTEDGFSETDTEKETELGRRLFGRIGDNRIFRDTDLNPEFLKTYQTERSSSIKEDFRREFTPENIRTIAPSYKNNNIESRLNLGDPGAGTRANRLDYTVGRTILDTINSSPIYSRETPDHSPSFNDLVKFSIGVVKNNDSGQADYMNFRAYIDSFSDSYSSDWGDIKYIGRGDKFYNYQGFDRTISLAFTVYAQSKGELIPIYKKLNYLASSLAPSYSTGGFMQGNLHRLTLGGYLYNQLGILKSITYDVPEESTWEIGIDKDGGFDSTVKELPHMIKVTNITFIPIQDFVPQRGNPNNQIDTRFIALQSGGNISY